MNRLGLAAIGYTPDDKVPRPDEGRIDRLGSKFLLFFFFFFLVHESLTLAHVCFSFLSISDYWSESDQDEVDGSMTLKQEGPSSLCDTYHRTPSVSTHTHNISLQCFILMEYFIPKSPTVFRAA